MSARLRWTKASGALLLTAVLSLASVSSATAQSHKKSRKALPPPLPSGPTGPVQQMPLDTIAAVPPQVSFQNNQLTIVASNSTLSDILRAVKKLTGAEIDVPSAPERVVTHLGPGPVREVMAELLNGSRFNYVLLGSPDDQNGLSRVVLVAKSGPQDVSPNASPNPNPTEQAQGTPQSALRPLVQPQQQEVVPEASDVDQSADDNAVPDDNPDQMGAEADQQENPGVKTPQQMLQEMQQRQLQLQQNQPAGQAPVPGSGMPPHPPQEQ
ncbi:MAG: hypothetical protein WA477_02265 [Candidatus Sulfotelmatobacter sp.]